MKKFISVILCVLLLARCGQMALAEGVDFSNSSLQELLEYRKIIEQEIQKRLYNEECIQLFSGYYESNKDIPEGEYVLTMINEISYGSCLAVFENIDDFMLFQKNQDMQLTKFRNLSITEGEPIHIRLDEDDVFFIAGGEFTIRKHLSFMNTLSDK